MKANFINYFFAVILALGLSFYSSCTHVPEQTSTTPNPVQSEESTVASPSYAVESLFSSLENRLVDDGIDVKFVQSIYQNPAVKLEPHIIAGNLKRSEKALDYSQYLTDASVLKATKYLNENQASLNQAFKEFGVPPSIVVAILTVETWLGSYTGKYPTINVLSTMAVAGNPQVQAKIFSFFGNETCAPDIQKQILFSLEQREKRGYRELKFLLTYLEKNRRDPLSIKGSVEGAIGIPQFLPSNIDHYGQDGDGDGIVNLFNHADAIASIACFLNAHQWKKARKPKEKKEVLLRYNRSVYYVNTVWALAERLNENTPEK
jgi:membrane-bound lytic murein transglycosylase B